MKNLLKVNYEKDLESHDYNYVGYARLEDIVKCNMYDTDWSLDTDWTSKNVWKTAFSHFYNIN